MKKAGATLLAWNLFGGIGLHSLERFRPPSATMSRTDDSSEPRNAARQHAWDWFHYHASQRLAVFRFFLLMVAFIPTGYLTAIAQFFNGIASILAILLAWIAFLFWRLDNRNAHLVKVGERHLEVEENWLRDQLREDSICLLANAEIQRREFDNLPPIQPRGGQGSTTYFLKRHVFSRTASFTQIYQTIFITVGTMSILALLYSSIFASTPAPSFSVGDTDTGAPHGKSSSVNSDAASQ